MIHQYKSNGMNIVLDIYSGAVHLVDNVVYDIIQIASNKCSEQIDEKIIISELNEKYSKEQINEGITEVKSLRDSELLFTKDVYKEVMKKFHERKPIVKALCLHIAHDCNLGCKYCFAGQGEYHGARSMMTFEVGKKALDLLAQKSGTRKNLEVDFFGGEPLMNFEVVKQLVEYGRSIEKQYNKNFRFTITTNGVLLNDEIIDYCNKNMCNVVLSIDGRKEVHDRMRPFRNGKGSYDFIIDKFKKVAELRHQKDYYVRGTYTRYNLDFSNDVLHLADLGFKEISSEPVVAPDNMPYALKEEDLPFLKNQYDILAKEMIKREKEGRGFTFFHFMIDLSQGPCVIKRLSGCGSGCEYLAVTPLGDLYPCHQFVGMPEFLMGNVDEGITNTKVRDKFHDVNVYSKKDCKNCWAKFYCSGGCTANAYNFCGDINGSYKIGCELEKKRIESAIMIKANEMMQQND